MGPMRLMGAMRLMRLMGLIGLISLIGLWPLSSSAQIRIGGNVYGGGNQGVVNGSTKVTVKSGDIGAILDPAATRPLENPKGKVFGGARMANVGGYSYVHIDGEHATGYILANQVFGGNDIAGQIGTAQALRIDMPADSLTAIKAKMPSPLPEGKTEEQYNDVDDTFNSYVRISTKTNGAGTPHADAKKVYIGQLFGGGNGDYDYGQTPSPTPGKVIHSIYDKKDKNHQHPVAQVETDEGEVGFQLPEQDKTYLEVLGGSIVYGYGGGNNSTVKTQNIIHYDNPSVVVNHILVNSTTEEEADAATYTTYETNLTNKVENPIPSGYTDLLDDKRFLEMGINTTFLQPSSDEFQVGRFFGGNNLAEMHIRPTWNLLSGKIRNLYSGGNKGPMTSPEGLLLEIKDYSTLIVDNLYGGCRMADVMPTVNGVYVPCTNLPGYKFPDGFSARVRVLGGHINNVYGGNDVTGTVYGGNAVGIYTTVYGDIYGGGNGAYPYTDNEQLTDNSTFGDFYYDPGSSSTEALKAFRPNAEQVSIRLIGSDAEHLTVIKGSVYLGGNCASLDTKVANPTVELKMGSHVIANNVFLGNNGAGMINLDYLKLYAGGVDENDHYTASGGTKFSSMNLTDASVMAEYMEGVTMTLQPTILFDKMTNGDPADYIDFSSYVGSFYCGGNIGSMGIAGKNTYHIDRGLNIFEKFVGGCNNADVPEGDYNAAFEGGVLGVADERDNYTDGDKIKDRLEINLANMTITPLRWNDAMTQLMWNTHKLGYIYTALEAGKKLKYGNVYYSSNPYIENTVTSSDYTVKETDEYFKKLEDDNTYLSVPTGTVLPVGSKYYTITGTANIVPKEGYTTTGGEYLEARDFVEVGRDSNDEGIRLLGGNVYGGCYESGHVNGNVVININEELLNKDKVFGNSPDGVLGHPASGVKVEDQRDDLLAVALAVFGAGYGKETEIWGSTTVNHNNGYAFQIFGGGEQGVVGKPRDVMDEHGQITGKEYYFNPAFSSTVNLNGASPIYSSDGTAEDLAETEYIYGGGNEGNVCGNTYVNLGNGRIYDAFGGASDADILGHTEVIIGRQPNGSSGYKSGFPWIRDIVYGGNDFGGEIHGAYEDGFDATARVQNYATVMKQLHGYTEGKHDYLLKGASYVEYLQGRVDTIFGGSYGYYDYRKTELYGVDCKMPRQESSFVNLRPVSNDRNSIVGVFGAGTGYPGNREDDKAQDHSYVLVDLTHENGEGFKNMEVFGSGSYNGLGMRENVFIPGFDLDKASAVVDLLHGEIGSAYGGSYREGNTARTVVNVPEESTIKIKNIFGGAYGLRILPTCDVIQTNVNYRNTSQNALVTGAIYGGNNSQRRSIFTNVNISSPVWSNKEKGYLATVYGAGKGFNSWSEHTHVEMLSGAKVYEVYGGGEMGHVLNAETVQKYMQNNQAKPSEYIAAEPPWDEAARWSGGEVAPAYVADWAKDWKDAWSLGDYYVPNAEYNNYFDTFAALRGTSLVRKAEIDERDYSGYTDEEKAKRQYIYNTNVIINEGAEVVNYAYGGGYGASGSPFSGDVWGHTYIALLGGTVKKDIYAAGTAGAVDDAFAQVGPYYYNTENPTDPKNNPYGFTASATAYVKGGTCRNVYGGGWEGNVGLHTGAISASPATDIPAETYVVIGDQGGSSFTNGIPAIQRNVYGGGEGGAVYGTAHVKLNKGYIGYEYNSKGSDNDETTDFDERYEEKIEDDTKETPNKLLEDAGNLFGGGYVDNSTVDKTSVVLNGGVVRNSVFGGGEIAAIGRGAMSKSGSTYSLAGIYRPGNTHVEMYKGLVRRNLYGGGRGYDNLGRVGSLNCAGYVFGQTEVHVHGGEIGTDAGLAKGDGNVFGGGDVGHVYSALEEEDNEGNRVFYKGVKIGERYGEDAHQGYYFKHTWADSGEGSGFIMDGGENIFTEDCKVLIEPMCLVTNDVTIDGTGYTPGEFVPIAKLNKLKDKNSDSDNWSCLDDAGIIIHNAVFAGGNNPPGSMATSANTASVFGNATASINDVYHRDLITLGTGHTGGLYGDGNLTLVDGYRELNITSYGTDYYSIEKEITIDQYHALPDREAAYYELRYTCLKDCKDKDGTQYHKADGGSKASTITADDLQTLFLIRDNEGNLSSVTDGGTPIMIQNPLTLAWEPSTTYWKESGVLPVYAGRLMNSIQRADFCGVFGSRMVMQGAQDRVPDEVDYTNYTINRVREVSLNKKESSITGDATPFHGNYFGIYNIVNYLGALTSDVDFGGDGTSGDIRTTDNTNAGYKVDANGKHYGEATFYDWKKQFHSDPKRNNGNSHNKVALASGVYLEITTEKGTGTGLYEKDWGPITGVVELDLINVSAGIGGGFVYAKNVHGKRKKTDYVNTTLTDLNDGAVTQWDYTYNATSSEDYYTHDAVDGHDKTQWQSSGNFVHSTQTIIDDCYNISNRYMNGYKAPGGVPAHYWYIKGSTYVYDQYISAYTGQLNAYSETVDIPLTLAAASHGKMKLLDVKPNLYAYYSAPGVKLESGKKMVINDKTYYANDPISYWDWYLLPAAERELFKVKTYTNCVSVNIDNETVDGKPKIYEPGALVMTADEYSAYGTHTYKNADGEIIKDADDNIAGKEYIFRESNNVSHDTGYLLTYEVNNPSKWDTWYTPKSDTDGSKITLAAYEAIESPSDKAKYEDGPTYRLNDDIEGGTVLGQQTYAVGDLISKDIDSTYQAITNKPAASTQATFEPAYLVTKKITVTEGGVERNYYPGSTVSETFAGDYSTSTAVAYICTKTVQVTNDNIILRGSKMTYQEWKTLYNSYKDGDAAQKKIAKELFDNVVPAYYCTKAGLYGGNYYVANHNYRGLEAWSAMSEGDREKFTYNYDALDLLVDSSYSKKGGQAEGEKYQYDSAAGDLTGAQANAAHYSLETSVDYTATYNGGNYGDETEEEGPKAGVKYMPTTVVPGGKVYVGDEITREQFEALPNEQRHYAPIAVTAAGTYYVVNTPFQVGATPYAVGTTISAETYNSLPNKEDVTPIVFESAPDGNVKYYCRDPYDTHTLGELISKSQYDVLPNQQTNFTIHGVSPTETSTLFVSRESDIYDLSKEKIITVIYQYDYDETDENGNVTPVSERHVLNIHLQFKSGVPLVEDITPPDLILPGWFNTMREPDVTPGAYEVTGGGWELFETKTDAERHSNGMEYDPSTNPLYWYQDSFYVAYYAKTYLGRTYSNHVPVRVANYHDLADVMSDANKAHHMYIDNRRVKREPKIYINDYSASGKNGLDLLKDLYDLTLVTGSTEGYTVSEGVITATEDPANSKLVGHALLGTQTRADRNLEFFLRTDIEHTGTWTPIGYNGICDNPATTDVDEAVTNNGKCFEGVFHGDGHTISGLDHSLFNHLCGEVYNLGVTGSFQGAGIAETGGGYVESCWIKTTATTPLGSKPNAVFGNPSDTKGYQLVNSYFLDDNKDLYNHVSTDATTGIITSGGDRGVATAKSAKAYYNGELAYDLNNFYLYKRYNDKNTTSGTEKQKYSYFTIGSDDNLVLQNNHYYSAHADLCSTGHEYNSNVIMYVEDRFADGDFRYAAGTIPDEEDERYYSWKVDEGTPQEKVESSFFPIYPDDYIFFGQKLTYGWAAEAHQDVPTAVAREDGRLSLSDDANRVYRAPAYFRSKDMGVYHFNPTAYLAFKSSDGTQQVTEKSMTAIDFAGHYDTDYVLGMAYRYGQNWTTEKSNKQQAFYPPLLDDDGLISIKNCDETQNLLVYAPAASGDGYANAKTHGVLTSYFVDPAYTSHYDNTKGYRLVSENTDNIYGHLVQSDLTATNDHLLVDKQDFNAPIGYQFDAGHLMWYQRRPSSKEYVNLNSGWQSISLPFTAELVTTDEKGEITHFYSGSETSKNGTGSKIGHEYWLREFNDIKEEGTYPDNIAKADFLYPTAAGDAKDVTNTFLWDYYYENTNRHSQKDANADTYLKYQQYYRTARSYSAYPLLTAGTPYILGLPGSLYYEFDLSGNFEAQNTAVSVPKLAKQVITFASDKGTTIRVSDEEMAGKMIHGYIFKPSYMNETLSNGDYVMNSDGDKYVKLNDAGTGKYHTTSEKHTFADATALTEWMDANYDLYTDADGVNKAETANNTEVTYYKRISEITKNETNNVTSSQSAFRPYFKAAPTSSGRTKMYAQTIIFSGDYDGLIDEPLSVIDGTLEIYSKDQQVITTSHLANPVTVTVVSVPGITYANYVLQPNETVATPVRPGVYIVNRKKILVK